MNIPIVTKKLVRVRHAGQVYLITQDDAREHNLSDGQNLTTDEFFSTLGVILDKEMWKITTERN